MAASIVHWRAIDGYPLCWPMTFSDGRFNASRDENVVNCPECWQHLQPEFT